MSPPFFVGLGGALRENSSTEKAMRIVLAEAERAGATTLLISGQALNLPLYAPERAHRTEAAQGLVEALARADGIILGSPGYHGSISGVVKNALDYAEDLRGDSRPYFTDRAVGCIATAGGWPGAVNTLGALRDIVHALRGWPTPLGVAINTAENIFDAQGNCGNPRIQHMLETMAAEIMRFAKMLAAQAVPGPRDGPS
jgi:FMN reductase